MVKDLTQNKKSVISVLAFCSPWRTIFALCAALGFGQLAADARARGSRKSWIPVLAALCAVGAAACSMGTLSGVAILPALSGFSAVGLIFCGAAALLRQREQPQMERGLLGLYLALCGAEIVLCVLCLYWARNGFVHVETGVLEAYQRWNRRVFLLEVARCAAGAGLVLRGSRAKE